MCVIQVHLDVLVLYVWLFDSAGVDLYQLVVYVLVHFNIT